MSDSEMRAQTIAKGLLSQCVTAPLLLIAALLGGILWKLW